MNESDLARFFERERKESQRAKYITLPACKDGRRILACQVVTEATAQLEYQGFRVKSQSHKAHFDLLAIGDDGALRVEVKASTWNGEQYQANLRGNDCDVLLFGCLDGRLHWFVIPWAEVRGRRVVKVSSHDPTDYTGRLTAFYDAWDTLPGLARSARNPYQPELWQNGGCGDLHNTCSPKGAR